MCDKSGTKTGVFIFILKRENYTVHKIFVPNESIYYFENNPTIVLNDNFTLANLDLKESLGLKDFANG